MPAAARENETRPRLFFPESWPAIARAAALLTLALLLAYHDAFSAPFVFDDLPGIVRNWTIHQLWPIIDVLLPAPATGQGAVAWPLVNLSFALNYAAGRLDVTGYHVVNLLIHGAAALLLFAVTQRTLMSPRLRERFAGRAFGIALAVTLVWCLHPLQTASVTNVIRRSELMAGLFLLLTLYAFIRAAQAERVNGRWAALAVLNCLAGMATNAAMAVAPVLVFLYDRTFVSSTWRDSIRRHGKLHVALALTWLMLTFLLGRAGYRAEDLHVAGNAGTAGQWLTQGSPVLKYLALSFWPSPLVFDYGVDVPNTASAGAPQILWLIFLAGTTVVTLARQTVLGFLGAWFLLTLAPGALGSSGLLVAEHRVYLPLAAVIAFVAGSAWFWLGRGGLIALFASAIMCGGLTMKRNSDYESAVTLWRDTVEKVPENPRAHYHLANALSAAGRLADAVSHYETALVIDPHHDGARLNLGGVLLQLGKADEAVRHYRIVLQRKPGSIDVRLNLAAALVRLGAMAEAVTHYETAARSGLLAAEEQLRFGRALAEVGRIEEALVRVLEAARLNPNHAETRVITGMILSAAGRTTEALQHFTAAVVADPNDASARAALGDLLLELSRPSEALVHYEAALELRPGEATLFHTSIGHALIRLGRAEEAIVHYETALQLNPDNQDAQKSLKMVRTAVQRRGLLKN